MTKTKATTPGTSKKTKRVVTPPTYDEIALRAYHIYLERGSTAGDPMEDWLRAERELAEPQSKSRRKSKVVSIAA
jgi:hypothetical protein